MSATRRGAGARPPRARSAPAALLAALAIYACGCGGGTSPSGLSEGGALAGRLPVDGALTVAIVDVDRIRAGLGLDPGSGPPTGSRARDLVFRSETTPALAGARVELPPAAIDSLLTGARSIASVSGDRAATVISTSAGAAELADVLRGTGLTEDEDGRFVTVDGTLAVAIDAGLIGIANDPGDAAAIVEDPAGGVPEALEQVDGSGALVTLARFGARCLDAVATSDSVGEPGEVAFFTAASPDPARVRDRGELVAGRDPAPPRIEGDSIRVTISTASSPKGEPPALRALSERSVGYDCSS